MTEDSTPRAYRVTGMSCEGCARAVANAIRASEPSAKVAVDLAAARIVVEGLIDEAGVAAAIAQAGFGFAGAA